MYLPVPGFEPTSSEFLDTSVLPARPQWQIKVFSFTVFIIVFTGGGVFNTVTPEFKP